MCRVIRTKSLGGFVFLELCISDVSWNSDFKYAKHNSQHQTRRKTSSVFTDPNCQVGSKSKTRPLFDWLCEISNLLKEKLMEVSLRLFEIDEPIDNRWGSTFQEDMLDDTDNEKCTENDVSLYIDDFSNFIVAFSYVIQFWMTSELLKSNDTHLVAEETEGESSSDHQQEKCVPRKRKKRIITYAPPKRSDRSRSYVIEKILDRRIRNQNEVRLGNGLRER